MSDYRPVHPIVIPPAGPTVTREQAIGTPPQGDAYDVLRASGSTDWHAVGTEGALCGIRPANGWAEASVSRLTENRNRVTCPRCAARISHLVRR